MLGGCGTVTLLFLINSVFRGAGDAAIAMRVLWFANTINIVLGPTLIFGLGPFPEMGVVGAATATTIGRGCGVLYQLLHLARPGGRLRQTHWRLDPEAMRSILRISGTATFQNFVATASWMGLIKILSGFGSAAVAGNTIGIRIVLFALLPSFGVSNAAATSGGPESRRRAPRPGGGGGVEGRPLQHDVSRRGRRDLPGVRAPADRNLHLRSRSRPYGIRCLRIVAAGFFFYGYGMVLTQAFNGAGDTRTPTWINLFCLWLWEIPLAWTLAYPAGLGPTGVFVAVSVAFSTLALVSAGSSRKGRGRRSRYSAGERASAPSLSIGSAARRQA